MDIQSILLVVFFALSTTTIPIYSYFTQKHFVKSRIVNGFQLLFWLFLAASSITSILQPGGFVFDLLNFLLLGAGVFFSIIFTKKIYKDQGQYFMPYAKLNNMDAFKEYGDVIGEGNIKIFANARNTVETIFFTNTNNKDQIMEEIGKNGSLVMLKGTKEAFTKLITNLLFLIVIAIFVFI